MANVLHDQQQQVSDHISSDLLFILRQCDSPGRRTRQQPPFPLSSLSKQDRKGSQSSISSNGEERRPSILNILMDSPPRSADDRRPSFKSSPLASPRSFINDRRKSNHSVSQERSNSLVPSIAESASSSLLALPPSYALSPPVMPITRSRQSSCSALSINAPSDYLDSPDLDASSNSKNSTTTDTKKRKEGSSFKQQLKRLVGWGSSSSPKLKKVNDLTISTSPSTSVSSKLAASQQQQQQEFASQSAFVSTGSNFSFTKAEGMQSNISTTSAPTMTGAASASTSSLPQQASQVSQQQQQQQQHPMAGRSTSWYINNNHSSHSILPSTPSNNLSTSTSSSSSSPPVGQWQHVDSVMMVHDASFSSKSQPLVSEESSNDILSHDTLPPPVPPKTGNESQLSGTSGSFTTTSSSNSALIAQSHGNNNAIDDDDDEYEDDDGMVSSGSSDFDDDDDDTETVEIGGVINSASLEDSDESDDPDLPEQRQRLHSVTSLYRGDQAKPRNDGNIDSGEGSTVNTTSNFDEDSTVPAMPASQEQPVPHQQHPQLQQQQQDDFDSDLFFLVTQGVDYLKTRECTKWEDEENGYRYHPWNRPQPLNSTAVTTKQPSSSSSSSLPPLPPSLPVEPTMKSSDTLVDQEATNSANPSDPDNEERYSDNALVSPPLSPSNLIQSPQVDKKPVLSSTIVTPKEVSVDDDVKTLEADVKHRNARLTSFFLHY